MLTGVLPLAGVLAGSAASAQPVGRFLLDGYFPAGIPGYYTEPGVTVLSRVQPDYEPTGVRAGDFILRPQASEAVGFNDNVAGTASGRQASALVNSQASLGVASDWGRDSLGTSVSVSDTLCPALPSQDTTVWSASLGGSYDIGRDQVQLGITHLHTYQLPNSIDSNGLAVPAPYDIDNLHVGYFAQFGRLALLPRFDDTQLRFSPANSTTGPQQSQSFNNRDIYLGALETRYEFSPQRNAVLEVSGTGTDYVSATAPIPGQNSVGYAVRAGVDYVASGLWRLRALVGYEQRDYQSSAYPSRGAPVGEATVVWMPTGLTTVTGRSLAHHRGVLQRGQRCRL